MEAQVKDTLHEHSENTLELFMPVAGAVHKIGTIQILELKVALEEVHMEQIKDGHHILEKVIQEVAVGVEWIIQLMEANQLVLEEQESP